MEAARKQQQEIVGLWPIPDMAQQMRVEHDRLAQLGWVYDGFGGYRKKAASSQVAGWGVLKQVELSAWTHGRFLNKKCDDETKKKDVVWFALNDDRPLFALRHLDRIPWRSGNQI